MLLRSLFVAIAFGSPAVGFGQSLSVADMREDIRFLDETWSQTDRSLTPERRERFDSVIRDACKRIPTLEPGDFALEVSRAVATARNGHSEANIAGRLHGLPIGFAWFSDGLFIVRADAGHAGLLGSRVEMFGSLSASEASIRAGELISGNDERVRQESASLLRTVEALHYIGASRRLDAATLVLRSPAGHVRSVSLGVEVAPDPSPAPSWMGVVPAPADTPGRWAHVLDRVASRPAIYRDVTTLDREWWQDNRVFYLRSNYIYGTNANRYELFEKLIGILQVEVAERRPKFAIIDLRLNHGGDFFNTASFSHALPKLIPPDGRIFVLVGPNTFSAAIATAAMLKEEGGDRVVFVGEKMGDEAEFWSEGPPVTLPHSRIVVTSGTRKQNWAAACAGSPDCYWGNVAFGPRNISLLPDIKISTSFVDYAAGRDVVLQAVLNAIQQ